MMAITATQQQDILRYTAAIFGVSAGGYMSTLADFVSAQADQTTATHDLAIVLASTPGFQALGFSYSSAATDAQFVTGFLANLLPSSITAANVTAAQNWMLGLMTNGQTRAQAVVTAVDAVAGVASTDANWGAARLQLDNRTTAATTYTITNSGTSQDLAVLGATISSVTEDVATITAGSTGATGTTYTLTTGIDTPANTSGDDTYDGTTTASTFSSLDTIDGGAGNDTLNATITTTTLPALSTVTNVETVNLTTSGAGFTGDFTGFTGLTALTVQDTAAGANSITAATTTDITAIGTAASNMTIIGGGLSLNVLTAGGTITVGGTAVANAFTSATLTNTAGNNIVITDRSGASAATGSTLTTVSLNGGNTNTVTGDGVTSLTLTNVATTTTTIVAAAGTRALDVTLASNTAPTVVDATATTATVTSTVAQTVAAANFASATTINLKATAATTFTNVLSTAATTMNLDATGAALIVSEGDSGNSNTIATMNVTGDSLVTYTNAISTGVTSIDASAATGGATFTAALNVATAYAGGSGVDTITIASGGTKAITTGAEDDVVVISGALGTGGSIDAGSGTGDILTMTEALAANDSLSANTTFAGTISNFEKLALTTVTGSKTVNLDNLDAISHITTTAATALVLDNLASAGTVEITAASTSITANVKDAGVAGHTTDILNITLDAATSGANVDYGTVVAANVETVNVSSTRTGTVVAADTNQLTITAANVVDIVVTGDVDLNIDTAITAASLSSIDASANTNGLTASVAAATQGITLTGSSSAANTLTGGAGGDAITGGSGVDTIVTGDGVNSVTAGGGADTITGGTGVDSINLSETTAAIDTVILTTGGAIGVDVITGFDVATAANNGDNIDIDLSDLNGLVTDMRQGDGTALTAQAAPVISQVAVGSYDMGTATANTDIFALAGDIASLSALETALEVGGTHALTSDDATPAYAAGDGFLFLWDDGADSHLSYVTFAADPGDNATFAAAGLTATDIVVFTGVADATTFVSNNFDIIA